MMYAYKSAEINDVYKRTEDILEYLTVLESDLSMLIYDNDIFSLIDGIREKTEEIKEIIEGEN